MPNPVAANELLITNALGASGRVISYAGDPTAGVGFAASVGTVLLRTDTTELYVKRATPDWAWWRSDGKPPWDWDRRSMVGCPSTSEQWARVIEIAGLTGTLTPPDALWLCQEDSGNLADSIGGYTLTADGAGLIYGAGVWGWDRRAVLTVDNTSHRWQNNDASLPNLATDDMALLFYAARYTQANNARMLMGMGTPTQAYVGGSRATRTGSGASVGAGTASDTDLVRPYGLVSQRSGATRAVAFSDTTKVTVPIGAVTGQLITIGGLAGVLNPSTNAYLFGAMWKSAPADAAFKAALTVLNWNILWTP